MRQLYCPSGLLSPGEAPIPLPPSRPAQAAYMHIFFHKHTYSTINIFSFIYDFLNLFSTLLYCKNTSCMLIDCLCHGYAFSQNQTISKLLGKSEVNVDFLLHGDSAIPNPWVVKRNWNSSFFALLHNILCCILGRVVNVSSIVSLRSLKNCSPGLQQKFRSETITEEELVGLMNKFVEDTKNGVHRKEGWPDTAYGVAKIGVTVLSRIHARKLSEQRRGDKILLNACCPGWVRTDMAGPRATKSPEEGAETPVYLALLPSDAEGPHGEFVMEKKVEQW
uniref:Carbonyl reductase [NADPH] 1 n=1 Tax=Panthera leo TaxID=9689 RepID=A0A8C8Y136_PANLE